MEKVKLQKTIKIKCTNINWETDGENVELPTSVVIELEEDSDYTTENLVNEFGADELSDQFGWLVNHYNWEQVK